MDDYGYNENSQQPTHGLDDDRLHEAIKIYMQNKWSKDSKEKIAQYVIEDAEAVSESLDYIKKSSPRYWEEETGLQELEQLIYDNWAVFQEYTHFVKDEIISIYMKDMMEYLLLEIFAESSIDRNKFLFSKDVFVNKIDKSQRKETFCRMEELYPNCYQIFSDIFTDKMKRNELFGGDSSMIADEIQDHYLPDKDERKDNIKQPRRSASKKIPAVVAVTVLLCCAVLVLKNFGFTGGLKNNQYNKWLTKSELEKVKKLEDKYYKRTGVEIRYFQRLDGDPEMRVKHDGSYLFLVYTSTGETADTGEHMMYSDILNDEGLFDFGRRFLNESDGLTDYKRCEKFFEMAYLEVTK